MQTKAAQGVGRLVHAGVLSAAQASVVDHQIAAGSIDPKQLVDSGAVDEAQMHAVAGAVGAAKAAG